MELLEQVKRYKAKVFFNYGQFYSMPKAACKNDDLLRDQWLQKLITDIWGDKEHYNDWRRQNDAAVESKKKEFTPKVDQLANIDSGQLTFFHNEFTTHNGIIGMNRCAEYQCGDGVMQSAGETKLIQID